MKLQQTPESSESGQGALELALSLPLFALLILGSAEMANFAWASVQVNNAARAGAAYASLSRANAANSANIGLAAQHEAPAFITAPSTQVTSSQVCSCVSSTGSTSDPGCTSTNLTNCPSPDVIQVSVQVNTTATVTTLIHYWGLPASFTLHAQATIGVEQ